ncbi:hypothetical protein HAZT_HAZT002578 [Hyalella azteca]|uniref:Dihydroxyacetone phosphate acyltransferase-like n=1 Tax=Hyalella azteca TaxID=294128 RepID=A0A6A0GPQ2_HYAAZ|nr:dihydroxyacetone phosphate acyltransferase-like [Hyalella azteca]KAA0183935.1 hypothetical protein HAZT_HAZT002578 [Hyalella azteca]
MNNPSLGAILTADGDVSPGYEDIVEPRRGQSDLRWAAQEWQSSGSFAGSKHVSPEQAMTNIMASEGLQNIMEEVAKHRNVSLKEVKEESVEILKVMAHQQDISAIRKFAFFLAKMLKAMYNKIVVHRPGIELLRKAIKTCPVVLLPTHRSYADFILVSYVSFHYNLPFPVIAAGMDFYHMAYIGQLLREAGAFYIKRSFVDDVLYWAVFQEYVKMLVCQESAPMEFFLEGTRSRTAKTLRPKLGLLGCVCQYAWLKDVSDVLLVPINISYDRTLEEELYAWELLGIPKPKESTSGLFKAKRILKEKYGNVFIHIGQPVSVKAATKASFGPGIVDFHSALSAAQVSEIDCLALRLARDQMRLAAVSSFSFAAHFLLMRLQEGSTTVSYSELLCTVSEMLASVADNTQGSCCTLMLGGFRDAGELDACLRYAFQVHSNLVSLQGDAVFFSPFLASAASKRTNLDESQKKRFVLHLMLQHYANQSIHVLLPPSLLCLAVSCYGSSASSSYSANFDVALERYSKLLQLFSFEFIPPADKKQSFDEAVARLVKSGCGQSADGVLTVQHTSSPTLSSFYWSCLKPLVLTYRTAITVALRKEWSDEPSLVAAIRTAILEHFTETDGKDHSGESRSSSTLFSALSLDAIKNSVRALSKLGALRCQKSPEGGGVIPCRRLLSETFDLLTREDLPPPARL